MWTPLSPIAAEPWFTKELRTAASKLNEAIQPLLADRQALDSAIARVKGEDPATVDVTNLVGFPAFQTTRCDLLQHELRVRRGLAEFWEAYFQQLPAAAKRAAEDSDKARAEIEAGLAELGFPLTVETGRAPWLPGVIQSHPRLAAARQNMLGLDAKMNDRGRQQANAEALGAITRELEAAVAGGLPR